MRSLTVYVAHRWNDHVVEQNTFATSTIVHLFHRQNGRKLQATFIIVLILAKKCLPCLTQTSSKTWLRVLSPIIYVNGPSVLMWIIIHLNLPKDVNESFWLYMCLCNTKYQFSIKYLLYSIVKSLIEKKPRLKVHSSQPKWLFFTI